MCNEDLRNSIKKAGVKYWQVADAMGISPDTFTRRMRHEMTDEKKHAVMDAIKTCKENQRKDGSA